MLFNRYFILRTKINSRFKRLLTESSTNWGYDCPFYGDIEKESPLLEKFIRKGCNKIVTSSGKSCFSTFEFLADLTVCNLHINANFQMLRISMFYFFN